jgi:2-polyprenyl-3-methyl-5-hydroxy-6-metoxy-1,4-benzoquinol methylase
LRSPEEVLRQATQLLSPTGRVVLSIPNVAHASVRLALLWSRSVGGNNRVPRHPPRLRRRPSARKVWPFVQSTRLPSADSLEAP